MQTSASYLYAEPAYVLVGEPTTADGAGFTDLDLVSEVTVRPLIHRSSATNERGIHLGDGQGGQGVGVEVSLQLHDNQISILNALFAEFTDETTAYGFETTWAAVSPTCLVIIPQSDKNAGIGNLGTIWIPGFVADDPGTITRRMTAGAGRQANSSPYTVTGMSTLVTTDANDEDLETWAQLMFWGSPDTALGGSPTTSWSFPTKYAAP